MEANSKRVLNMYLFLQTFKNKKMGYITTERVDVIRKELKAAFPDYKFSISKRHHSTIVVSILEAPLPLTSKPYESVNIYWLRDIKDVEKRTVLEIIKDIANKGITWYETGDYGNQPSHYLDLSIGTWEKSFKMTIKNDKGKTVAALTVKRTKENNHS